MTVTRTVRSTASAVRIMQLSVKKVSIPGPASQLFWEQLELCAYLISADDV